MRGVAVVERMLAVGELARHGGAQDQFGRRRSGSCRPGCGWICRCCRCAVSLVPHRLSDRLPSAVATTSSTCSRRQGRLVGLLQAFAGVRETRRSTARRQRRTASNTAARPPCPARRYRRRHARGPSRCDRRDPTTARARSALWPVLRALRPMMVSCTSIRPEEQQLVAQPGPRGLIRREAEEQAIGPLHVAAHRRDHVRVQALHPACRCSTIGA